MIYYGRELDYMRAFPVCSVQRILLDNFSNASATEVSTPSWLPQGPRVQNLEQNLVPVQMDPVTKLPKL